MKYICVQPDIPYFHWQIEVMLQNFIDVDIDLHLCNVVFIYQEKLSDQTLKLQEKYPTVNFIYYKDEREDRSYIPSLKPYGMYRYALDYPDNCQFLYHDCDIIFREKINESLFIDQTKWYMSDTISYIGYNYCVSKGLEQLQNMADIVGIPIDIIKENQANSGGAQYIIPHMQPSYWLKVYQDSNTLYRYLHNQSQLYNVEEQDILIQKWCAEMWATLWNVWYFQHCTIVHKELDFCFSTSLIENFSTCKILHNAGVTEKEKSYMFFKGEYIEDSPFEADLQYVDKKYCSYQYKQAVDRVVVSKKQS